MSTFDEDLFLKGLEQRKATLARSMLKRTLPPRTISPARSKKR